MYKVILFLTLFLISKFSFGQKAVITTISETSQEVIDFKNSQVFKNVDFKKFGTIKRYEKVITDKTKGEALKITSNNRLITMIVTKNQKDYDVIIIKSIYSGKKKNTGKLEYYNEKFSMFFFQNFENGEHIFTSPVFGTPTAKQKNYRECVEAAENELKNDFLGDIALETNPLVGIAIRVACAINPQCFD